MHKEKISSFQDYLEQVEWTTETLGYPISLFRGQSNNFPLLPSIARKDPHLNTTSIEKKMLDDLKRRSQLLISKPFRTDWEWLVYAQHFGLKTRLLDWTSNPLTALWFACTEESEIKKPAYVYVLSTENDMLVDLSENDSPFENLTTKILKPSLNNERIIAQAGWFTAHKYSSKNKKFITLETNSKIKHSLITIEISPQLKGEFLRKLSIFGVNASTIYPDIMGLCKDINWNFQDVGYNKFKRTTK